jgi:hypothetical protein
MVAMTNLQKKVRQILGIQEVFESAAINSALLQQILEEQRRLRMLIAEQFAQKSPISFEQMDAIMGETRDRLDVAIMSVCGLESQIAKISR